MRTRWGWALSGLGVLVALLGAAVMVVLGPDSRFSTGPHAIETDDTAVVTTPRVISWADVQVDVLAEVPVRKPVFVGLANSVDVRDYVSKTKRLEVTKFRRPWTISTRAVEGNSNLPGAPTALDWWIASSAGLGGASISTQLPDQSVSLAILSVGSSNLSGLQVSVAYGVKGGFAKGAGLLLLGVALVWVGVLVRRDRGWDDEDDLDDEVVEEVVYVYVDDDGVEHEISAEEAETFEVVEEVVEVDDADVEVDDAEATDEPEPEPQPEPESEAEPEPEPSDDAREAELVAPAKSVPPVPGILTAADIAAGVDPASEPDPEPNSGAEPDPDRVVYVYVDEDGVEHEVSEDELAEFEVVDEEDET